MKIAMTGTPGNYWLNRNGKDYGPFNTILDASFTAVEMVTDEINAIVSQRPQVFFIEPPKVTN